MLPGAVNLTFHVAWSSFQSPGHLDEQPQGGCRETEQMPRLLSSWSWLVGLGQGSRVLDLHWPGELLWSLETGHWGLACHV